MSELARVEPQQYPQRASEASAIISVIERAAMNPDVDIEKMERLLDMQERILNRNAEQAFNAAMAAMQGDLPEISEQGEIAVNGVVRSKYARFEDINEAVKPILQQYGFAISFRTEFQDGTILVTGILSHKEGHREQTTIRLPADTSGSKNSVQAIGSTVSYGQRYTMKALLNITSRGEDDDGNQGKGSPHDRKFEAAKLLFEDSINAIKRGIAENDLSTAAEEWFTLPDNVKEALWKAPTKGGCFTTVERQIIKTTEFRLAYYGAQASQQSE